MAWVITEQDKAANSEGENSSGLSSHCENEKLGLVSEQEVGCENNVSWSTEEVSDRKAGELHLDESGSQSKTTLEANLGILDSEEDNDMFKQHFGSLSNTHKMDCRKSVVRKFSARYVVQQDYPGDCTRLFCSPVRNMTDKIKQFEDKAANHTISEHRSLQEIEVEEVRDSSKQDLYNSVQGLSDSTCESTRCHVEARNAADNLMSEGRDQKQGICEGNELAETISACKEAFGSLNTAAENAVQLFSKFEKVSGGDISRGAGAEFCNEAAQLLPLIVEKINAVAKLVQCRKNDQCKNSLGVPEMDFGRFSEESISDNCRNSI